MGRSPCCSKKTMRRGAWTQEEDQILINHVKGHGEGKWSSVPKKAGLKRCGKSCRLRWLNYLRPNIKRGNITPDEEELIIRLHKLLGNRWSLIAGRLPGRTDNEIKNYWNTNIIKKPHQVQSSFNSSQHNKHSSTPPPIDISQDERKSDEENDCPNNLHETKTSTIETSMSLSKNINLDDKTQDNDLLWTTNDLEKNNDSSNSNLDFDLDENFITSLFDPQPFQLSDFFTGDIATNTDTEAVLSPNSTEIPQVDEEDHNKTDFNHWLATFLDCDMNWLQG